MVIRKDILQRLIIIKNGLCFLCIDFNDDDFNTDEKLLLNKIYGQLHKLTNKKLTEMRV